jgi:hypothetical protein
VQRYRGGGVVKKSVSVGVVEIASGRDMQADTALDR